MIDLKLKRFSEHPIQQRRENLANQDQLQNKLRNEFLEEQHAKWENRGDRVCKEKRIKSELARLKEQARQALQARKEELAYMFQQEHQVYKQEIENMQETTEQVQQKMKDRVQHLKAKRETVRQHYVERQLEVLKKENCDELRQIDVQHKLQRIVQERDQQMLEKQQQLLIDYEEELVYTELYKRDLLSKDREHRQKEALAQSKLQEKNKILEQQKNMKEEQDGLEKRLKFKEQVMMQREYDADIAIQKNNHLQGAKQVHEQHQQNIKFNIEQKMKKTEYLQEEKRQDKVMVLSLVEREQRVVELESSLKDKEKQENMEFMEQNKGKQDKKRQYEKYLQGLVDEQDKVQWQKQMAKWQAQEDQRVQLMYQVYADRDNNIQHKQGIRDEEKEEKVKDKQQVTSLVQEFHLEQQALKLKEIETNKVYQEQLVQQIGEKTGFKSTNLQEKVQQEKEERLKFLEYDRMVKEQRQLGEKKLMQQKMSRPF